MGNNWLDSQEHFIRASKEDQKSMQEWFDSRPTMIQESIMKCPPWKFYRIKGGNAFGCLYSYEENKDGSVTCKINLTENVLLPRTVFGVPLSDLVEVKEPPRGK